MGRGVRVAVAGDEPVVATRVAVEDNIVAVAAGVAVLVGVGGSVGVKVDVGVAVAVAVAVAVGVNVRVGVGDGSRATVIIRDTAKAVMMNEPRTHPSTMPATSARMSC